MSPIPPPIPERRRPPRSIIVIERAVSGDHPEDDDDPLLDAVLDAQRRAVNDGGRWAVCEIYDRAPVRVSGIGNCNGCGDANPSLVCAECAQRIVNDVGLDALGKTLPREEELDDGGRYPSPEEIDQAMRYGYCDDEELVGQTVLYQTDERGGRSYFLPAIVTCARSTHPDLPKLLGALEAEHIIEVGPAEDATMMVVDPGWVAKTRFGYHVGDNPVPVPLEGTVHLHVLTPGPQEQYTEFSVPYSATKREPRTWRNHPASVPF